MKYRVRGHASNAMAAMKSALFGIRCIHTAASLQNMSHKTASIPHLLKLRFLRFNFVGPLEL